LYVYEKILEIPVEERTEQQKKFVEEFDKISEDLNIDLSVFKPIKEDKPIEPSIENQPKMMSTS
jgi:hypothetical protein